MSIGATDIAFVGYPVTDVERARRFYEETLGLTTSALLEFDDGKWWIEYTIGSGTLAISNAWPPSGQSGPGVALEVADIEAARAHCALHDVPIAYDIMDTPVCRFFGIKDPDGNDITLHQTRQAPA
ncbi:MAG: VOC family protein [Verrucomicrobia bacterium]|nr:MAG: VOC family protein [Verrucomicrobiota bacterium]